MSIRQLLITDTINADYGKISPLYIPTSLKPIGNDTSLGLSYPLTTGLNWNDNGSDTILKFFTDQTTVPNTFNITSSKYSLDMMIYIDVINTIAETNTFDQPVPPIFDYRLINGLISNTPFNSTNFFSIKPSCAINTVSAAGGRVSWCFSLSDIITLPPIWQTTGINGIQCQFDFTFNSSFGPLSRTANNASVRASLVLTPCL